MILLGEVGGVAYFKDQPLLLAESSAAWLSTFSRFLRFFTGRQILGNEAGFPGPKTRENLKTYFYRT